MMHAIYNGSTGSESPRKLLNPIGIAPLNSISGTIDTKNTNKYFFNINVKRKEFYLC